MNQDNSFAPIERLMEFGMSIAVANQMIQTMNEVMAKSNKPSLQNIGLQQINTAVSKIDEMTQHNASLVQESVATSADLEILANRLRALTATFNLN